MTFMILLKLHVWEKLNIKYKNALGQSDCRILKQYLKNCQSCKVDFMHAGTYLLKIHIDDVILGRCGEACPGITKKAIKT